MKTKHQNIFRWFFESIETKYTRTQYDQAQNNTLRWLKMTVFDMYYLKNGTLKVFWPAENDFGGILKSF